MAGKCHTDTMHLSHHHRFTLRIPEPFDFSLTVAKPAGWHWATPKETFGDGILWSGIRLGGDPVGLKMQAGRKGVEVQAFSKKALGREALLALEEQVGSGLGAGEDLAGFYRFARDDPILAATVDDLYGMRVGMFDDIFGDTILAILLQMAPMARSNQMMEAVLDHYGTTIGFDGKEVTLWPRAEEIALVDPADLREKAKLGYRADRLVHAARYLSGHPLSQRELSRLPQDEAVRMVTAIPGVGPYSAGIILGGSSLPVDTWSVMFLSELFLGETPENPRKEIPRVVSELAARWGKWSWLAFVYVANDLPTLAKTHPLSRIT
jgi:3-methyladenine DNA glycosylase/8-oxoguanine DNA glycosylase